MKNSARNTLFLASVVMFSSMSFHSFAGTTPQSAQPNNQVPASATKNDSSKTLAAISGSDPRPKGTVVAAISGSDPRPKGTVVAAISGSDPRPKGTVVA